jgi:phosphatidylglycerophosphate synthase
MAVAESRPRVDVGRGAKQRPARELAVDVVFGPLASLVVQVLLPLRVAPAAVVLAHGVVGLVAAIALARGELVAAALLIQLKTVLDNADGRLARSSGRVSLLGRHLDTEVDLVVNAALFAALAHETGQPWLALAAFLVVTATLSVAYNTSSAFWAAHGSPVTDPPATGSGPERVLAAIYRAVFGWQDRVVQALSTRRLGRIIGAEPDPARAHAAALAYHDRGTMAVLANLGLSTHLLALGAFLVAGRPGAYLWLAVTSVLLLPALQVRRERRARRALALG